MPFIHLTTFIEAPVQRVFDLSRSIDVHKLSMQRYAEARELLRELVEIRHASRPSVKPEARYNRALELLRRGEVDTTLAETMRLPGAARANAWAAKARRYVAVQRALDEVESAALLAGNAVPR